MSTETSGDPNTSYQMEPKIIASVVRQNHLSGLESKFLNSV